MYNKITIISETCDIIPKFPRAYRAILLIWLYIINHNLAWPPKHMCLLYHLVPEKAQNLHVHLNFTRRSSLAKKSTNRFGLRGIQGI